MAPSKASLDKEFVFFNNTDTNLLKDMPELKDDPLFVRNSNLLNYSACLTRNFGMERDGMKFQNIGAVDRKQVAGNCFSGIASWGLKAVSTMSGVICGGGGSSSSSSLPDSSSNNKSRAGSRDTNDENVDGEVSNFDDWLIPTSVPGKFTTPDPKNAGKLRKLLNIEPHVKIILMVNRLAPEKRVELAIRQLAKAKYRNKYHLVIVGDGP